MLRSAIFLAGIITFLFFNTRFAAAQVSEGGYPLQVISTKSAVARAVEMPAVKQSVIDSIMEENLSDKGELKSLQFAYGFHVQLSPDNSGDWYPTNAGNNVWKLTVKSEGAQSLFLIFDNFQLPDGARLFLYNEKEEHYLGAYTSRNNKTSRKFAVSPVAGDEVTIQYEVPQKLGKPNSFELVRVNHDFLGIIKSDRRPTGTVAGSCNIDVNCSIADRYAEIKNAVCRLIVPTEDGAEVCSGTLVNNTAEDGKPYILSAGHCYDKWEFAETAVYTFNYESPYCAPLDGDPGNSISGAEMKAQHDSLDFALVEMSLIPPPTYRPYYAGWSHSSILPDSSVSIHHPQGDVKKIAIDNDAPTKSNFRSEYTPNAFLKISKWEEGVTENGSSGGGLFNTKGQLIGTLTGGQAVCSTPINDYFANFAVYWDYRSDTTKQVKYWLDPLNKNVSTLDGKQFNSGENLCGAFTNLNDNDEHANIRITSGGSFAGYWGGTNSVGITEIVEQFTVSGSETVKGVSLGVGKIVKKAGATSSITVKVYEGTDAPKNVLYSKNVNILSLAKDAMNYIPFDTDVEPVGTFFVGFDISNVQAQDTFVLYQSLRNSGEENNFFYKRTGDWYNFESNDQGAITSVMELIACNFDQLTDTPIVKVPAAVWLYPNPVNSVLNVVSDQEIVIETVAVYNVLGQEINVPLISVGEKNVQIDLSGNTPGTYIIRFNYNDSFVTRKFSVMSK
ncbi:T9SS type A sorting domain-containing protein [Maribellus sp. CM-23]|uniref:T9SS type A sorting domain-containing protein n=1 Tax=Maribellus sp. CM-23 TaxID=2781026 RepID=UPI001F1D6BAA|nr:T9SS type A sorting domain-containing protein [Maribellus sp. CM-23]MCE4564859.1 T9SS type A sorting domain-containing protein [Maribellus sp. CM-23]